ncbi:unnamed protein product, partial [Rotaria magnacalcarata]
MGHVPTTRVANACPYPIWGMCDTIRQHSLLSVKAGSVEL